MPERHVYFWSALFLFSLVNLTSTLDLIPNNRDNWDRDHKWVVTVSSISLCLSGLGVICLILMKDKKFIGSKGEGGMALVLLAFWSAGMSTIVDPDAEPALAVDADREVNDANLFFSSWAAFTLSLVLFIKSSQHILGVHGTSTMEWVGLATANFITMAVGAQGWNDSDCGDVDGGNEEIYCDRTGFAIILGLVSGVAAVGMSLLRHKMVLQLASIISLVAWCFGVAYITYEKGPGNKVGVLFCSTWTSLVISLYLAVKSVQEFIADRAQSGEEGVTAAKDDDTDEHPMHDEESPEEGLKDVPRTDVKNSTEEEEGPPGVLKFKNSLDEIEEYEIEEIDDDGNAVEIEEKEEDDDDDESNKDEAAEKVAGGSFGGTSS